ncbi:MAG: AMP-binding protein [Candidatus Binatia bacterium]
MTQSLRFPEDLPEHQRAIHARCFHPSGKFEEFRREDIEQSIPSRFEQIVRRYPDRIAVQTESRTLSYAEVNARANRLAHEILFKQGREVEPVVLLLEDRASLVAAMLGVSKAGKIFVPVDASFPEARIKTVFEDSEAALVITDRQNLALAKKVANSRCRLLNFEANECATPAEDLRLPLPPAAPAVIFYTSGSTGQPKGVLWTHQHLLHSSMLHGAACNLCAHDRMSLLSSGTSNAVTNTFAALLHGAALLPFNVQNEGARRLADWLLRERISVCFIGSPLFRVLCESLSGETFPDLRFIRLRSDTAYKSDVELYKRHFPGTCVLINGLSSSETGPLRTYYIDHETEIVGIEVPVGYAVDDKEILLLDDAGKEVGFNEVGEMVVRSTYLSPGYWRRPQLTEAKFKPDPHGGEQRLYFTGDLGLVLPDGCLIHKGRKDYRTKIRGYSVEFGEVQKAILEHPGVLETVVVAQPNALGEAQLVAYVVPPRNRPSVTDLQKYLRQKLPDYMIPSGFVILDALPLAASGKVDRRALPPYGRARPELENPFVAPENSVEQTLAGIWAEVIGLDQIGIHDNFLDLGGHSLAASRIISRVIDTFRVELPVQSLLEAPTVAKMTLVITQNQSNNADKDITSILSELEALSDQEAQHLLARQNLEKTR